MIRQHWWVVPALAAVGFVSFAHQNNKEATPEQTRLVESLHRARGGKYRMLLHQVKVPAAKTEHGDFAELGFNSSDEFHGAKNIPAGFRVYVAPYLYVFRDEANRPVPMRAWGPEQVIGPPNVWPSSGDIQQAWASRTPDGQDEWLLLEYSETLQPTAILVYETFNPGAVERITAFNLEGEELEIWKGKDPTPIGSPRGLSVFPVRLKFKTTRIKLYLASTKVPGWNEIDAVGVRSGGKVHWASAVEASTTYAQQVVAPQPPPQDRRLDRIEADVKSLRERIRRLQQRIDKMKP